jgi:hypothetical protein
LPTTGWGAWKATQRAAWNCGSAGASPSQNNAATSPREGEAPAEPTNPWEGEAPAEPPTPWEGEAPAEPTTPREGEAPAEPATPWEGEAPAEPANPWEGEAPAEPPTPWEGEAPAEPWDSATRQPFGSAGASPSRRVNFRVDPKKHDSQQRVQDLTFAQRHGTTKSIINQ